ncbi:hypothetical protein diail_2759 [Diaporthe ilicicola]|nr:hypothetical protein diail_2759 [Diaporthe ilicicola]
MASNKENDPNAFSGSTSGPSTNATTSNSQLAKPTKNVRFEDAMDLDTDDPAQSSLDDILTGGCSTCGSFEHATVQCGETDISSALMMSGALQTGADLSAPTTASGAARASSMEKSGQTDSVGQFSQGKQRRRSV